MKLVINSQACCKPCNCWSLGMDKLFQLTYYCACDYLSVMKLEFSMLVKWATSLLTFAATSSMLVIHDDVIKWKHFPRYCQFLRGIHRFPVNSPYKRPVTRSFDVFFYLRLNTRLRKQSWGCWFETLSRPIWGHCNAPIIIWSDPYDINWLLTAPVEMHWLSYFMIILSWLHLALADINQYVTKVVNNHHTLSNARLGSVYVHIQLT